MASHDVNRDGVLRSYSDSPPTHYTLSIKCFKLMDEQYYSLNGYETESFNAGGYKWKLVIYPKGNKKRNVADHISLYLEFDGATSPHCDYEVYVDFRIFLLDQRKGKYLVLQDAFAREVCFHRVLLRSPIFDKLMPLKEFTDASNGYVNENTCVLGAEVFVRKERTRGQRECLSRINNAFVGKHVWKVEKFSKLTDEYCMSEPFDAGDQKWRIQLFPKGFAEGKGTHLSVYLVLADWKQIPPVYKLFAEFYLRLVDQKHGLDKTWTGKHCFTTKVSSSGKSEFISLNNLEAEGFLMKNTCILEAEVSVYGVSKPA